ncbi:MAG: sorbosone dehydrogenase family protein [Armatimonadetes bacterium]|jgi:glucose/arabinose dehydrogenase|nr:sorbosone dehydrogenase family protein [Armatimonadota bacterium]
MRQHAPAARGLFALGTGLLLLLGCRGADGEAPADGGTAAAPPPPAGESTPLPPARAQVPRGFRIETVTDALPGVRMLAFSPDGRLFATQPRAGRVVVVPVGEGRPQAWATGLNLPHGIAFHNGRLYVAETDAVVRWPYQAGSARAPGEPQRIAALPAGGGHWTRTVRFGPDGAMYVAVGSSCNVCIEEDPRRAALLRFPAPGDQLSGLLEGELYATGLRNTVDFAWDRQNRLWGVDNGRDHLGDTLPPEELNLIRQGGFYGWPYAYGDRVPDPEFGERNPERVRETIPPAFTFPAHSAPLGIAFYEGDQFPPDYRGDLFVALHGSWNRSTPIGYQVVRVHYENGQPRRMTEFITGLGEGGNAWARPVGIVVGPDGSLFVSDDKGGHIFRVRYVGGS